MASKAKYDSRERGAQGMCLALPIFRAMRDILSRVTSQPSLDYFWNIS